ncbi:MAG: MBOAT family protein [Butyrivibrio sp.]|nr:MBOAT family protein [Butyrivibrio sp.]
MVFSSNTFMFAFLPITLIGVYILRKNRFTNIWLLILSIIFFGWTQPQYLWIIFLSILINYFSALLINACSIKKMILALSVFANLSLLFYFKYFNFCADQINVFLPNKINIGEIILPVGISFFTFQGMSYVIDVYRNTVSVQKNPLKVALYITLFPQLVAGPIVRYSDIATEIDNRKLSLDDLSEGITRFIIGIGKKAIIANGLAEVVDSIWNAGVSNNTVAIAWFGSIAYSLQIFYDFSGYSDMAIGIGRMLGFHFSENFNRPYISKSISEFWRRWHISLSSWLRDYLYIPLGGNRSHVYRNLFIVFLLTGVWHGAAWNYIFWGVYNGLFILLERLLKNKKNISSHIYTLLVVNIGWVFFRADTMKDALRYLGTMFGIGLSSTPGFSIGWYANNWSITLVILAILDITGVLGKLSNRLPVIVKYVALYGILFLSVIRIVSGTYNPFIYFQF